jgi:RNA polymerase sigma factor (sigma-70 family)
MAERCETTRWSIVVNAAGEGTSARDALTALCETYRPPVLAYLRARVQRGEDAEDLTQEFFTYLLERRLAARADPERGRFRAFLFTSLKNFMLHERERANALRRGGGVQMLSGVIADVAAGSDSDPEQAFDREWARTVLREAVRRLEQEAVRAGRRELFSALRPYLTEEPGEADYAGVADAQGMRRNTVAVAVHRMRARLRELVLEVVADTAHDATEVDAELKHMRAVLFPTRDP